MLAFTRASSDRPSWQTPTLGSAALRQVRWVEGMKELLLQYDPSVDAAYLVAAEGVWDHQEQPTCGGLPRCSMVWRLFVAQINDQM